MNKTKLILSDFKLTAKEFYVGIKICKASKGAVWHMLHPWAICRHGNNLDKIYERGHKFFTVWVSFAEDPYVSMIHKINVCCSCQNNFKRNVLLNIDNFTT